MKVENQKTFKFSFQLTLQLGKEEKLKVINWWDRLTKKVFLIFFMLIFNLYLFTFQGKSWIQMWTPQGRKMCFPR